MLLYMDAVCEGRRETPSPWLGHCCPPWLPPAGWRAPPAEVWGRHEPLSPIFSRTRLRPVSTVPCRTSIFPKPPWVFSKAALDCSRTIMLSRRRSASPSIWVSLVVRTVSATRLLPFASALTSPCTPVRTLCTDFSKRVTTLSIFSSSLRRMLSSSCFSCLDVRSSMRDCMPRAISDPSSTVLDERPIFCAMPSMVFITLSLKSACWRSCCV
mmetsp:Transcript_61786/g.162300  ORF Transcript_61786/g.162300 Transcript_61786/m.162300 type:complete len:212 (-) Transcript_61786:1091-1726(-)